MSTAPVDALRFVCKYGAEFSPGITSFSLANACGERLALEKQTRMKNTLFSVRRGALVCALGFFGLAAVSVGQEVSVGKVEFDNLPSPEFGGTKNKSFRPKDWLEFEAGIKVPAYTPEQEKSGFIDQIVVKWSVALKNPEGRGFILITKDITHINVPVDEEVYSSVYLSPNTLKRLTGRDKAGKTSVDRVLCEVLINGRMMGASSSKGGIDWVQKGAGSLSDQSSRFPLLTKYETPFKAFWWDRYMDIEERR